MTTTHPLDWDQWRSAYTTAIGCADCSGIRGWDGELAHHMLDMFPTIQWWTNIELCTQAAWAHDHDHDPTSGGHARACLYTKP